VALSTAGSSRGHRCPTDHLHCNINIAGGTAWPCHCGASCCCGTTTGDFFLLPSEIQREYRPLLADWFVRRHAARLQAGAS
jgi:hypothetical protein